MNKKCRTIIWHCFFFIERSVVKKIRPTNVESENAGSKKYRKKMSKDKRIERKISKRKNVLY